MSAPIVVTGTVVGAERVVQRLSIAAPGAARERLKLAIRKLGYQLEATVRTVQLNGGVLQRRSGRLAGSINTRFVDAANESTAFVGTNKLYGRIWELTGSRAFTMVPRFKKALFWPGAANPYRSAFHPAQSKRPFLKPALDQMRGNIHTTLTDAMKAL